MKKQIKHEAGSSLYFRFGFMKNNPVFVSGLALPFCIVPTTTLINGLVMGSAIIAATLPTSIIAAAIGKKIKREYQLPAYSIIAMGCVLWFMYQLQIKFPDALTSVGIYLPLAAVNTIMIETCYRDDQQPKTVIMLNSIRLCFGFFAAVVFISAIRELVIFNTLLGINAKIQIYHLNAFSLPFFGFLMIGFVSALFNVMTKEKNTIQLPGSDDEESVEV